MIVHASMINRRGKIPVLGVKIAPVAVAIAAPPAVLIVPPIPDADPAKCGRTDIIPAVAFGKTIPLPRPMKQTQPKKERGMGTVNKKSKIQNVIPTAVIMVPVKIILLMPRPMENRPDSPLPAI